MIISSVLALGLLRADTANLGRVFKAGEKQEYAIAAHLLIEARDIGLLTWVPEELDINYKFNTEVKESKADGIVDMVYLRPTMTQIEGETADSPPKSKVEKTDRKSVV